MGTHAYEMTLDKFLQFMVNFYPMPIIYPLCIMFAKTSLLSFYLRLSPVRLFQAAVYFGIAFVAGSGIGLTFATAFPCKPLETAWNRLIDGTCIDRSATYQATASLGLISDVYIILLPIPTIYNLTMPTQQKIGLIVMFAVGILTFTTSILRLVIIIGELSDADLSWGSGPTAFWLVIEAYLMVVCASLTSLRRFFKHIAPKLIGEQSSGSNSSSQPQHSSELVTFGGTNKQYRKFTNEQRYSMGATNIVRAEVSAVVEDHGSSGDGNSQKGILQIHTTTVTYEQQMDAE